MTQINFLRYRIIFDCNTRKTKENKRKITSIPFPMDQNNGNPLYALDIKVRIKNENPCN